MNHRLRRTSHRGIPGRKKRGRECFSGKSLASPFPSLKTLTPFSFPSRNHSRPLFLLPSPPLFLPASPFLHTRLSDNSRPRVRSIDVPTLESTVFINTNHQILFIRAECHPIMVVDEGPFCTNWIDQIPLKFVKV